MLVQSHDSGDRVERQGLSLVEDSWAMEVVPRLPANLAEQALALKAFQRVRSIATPHDLLRGVLAYVLGPLSTRRLGAWAVLVGVADISEAAWRKRLRARNPWLLWLLSALVSTAAPAAPRGGFGSWMPAALASRVGRAMTGCCIWPTTSPQVVWARSRSPTAAGGNIWSATSGSRGRGSWRTVAMALAAV